MTRLEFTASQVGTDISFGAVNTGASTAINEDPIHYVMLQIPEDATSLQDIYVEIDDQSGGCYGNLARSQLINSQWIIDLIEAPRTHPSIKQFIVNLSSPDRDALHAGLSLVAGVAEGLVAGGA